MLQAHKLVQRSGEGAEELDRRDLYLQYRALERECTLALAAQLDTPEEVAAKRRCRHIVASWRSCMMSRQQQGAILNGATLNQPARCPGIKPCPERVNLTLEPSCRWKRCQEMSGCDTNGASIADCSAECCCLCQFWQIPQHCVT